ncbi:MAG TPA: aminoglycoside phosphotransferase family protein [Steroidobacteraceae bacterium]|nr:aminoglycoside phosphotransferase family protein [Steroidobacteraceae bacterium]
MGRPVLTAAMDGPSGEVQVDVELVEVLLAQQHPNLATLPVRAGESGFDNFMFRLGESFAVRLPRTAAAARLLVNEQRWLLTLSDRLPLQIPVPIRVGQPAFGFPWRWSVVPWLVGATAEISPVAAPEAPRLASFLRALHVAAPADAPRNFDRAAALTSRAAAMGERMRHLERTTDVMNDRIREAWSEALEAPNDTPPTWIHGDLHARNVLTLEGTLTGVIDWGDMTSGDPAIDLACLWMLLPGKAARTQAQRAYNVANDALWARARGWAVLFGVTLLDTGLTGNARNAAMGEQILRRI